jgi:hypothetical protein
MVGPPFCQEERNDKLGDWLAGVYYYNNSFFFFRLDILYGEPTG